MGEGETVVVMTLATVGGEVLPEEEEELGRELSCVSSSSFSSSSSSEASLNPWYHSLVRRCISTCSARTSCERESVCGCVCVCV